MGKSVEEYKKLEMTRNELQRIIREDELRFGYRKPTLVDWLLHNENYYIWHFIHELRYVEYYKSVGNKLRYAWHFIKFKRLSWKLHYTVYPNTCDAGLMIYHAGGFVHVGQSCKIGKNCTLLPGVVFGHKYENAPDAQIIVGDNCYFGLNVAIFGPVRIGNNVTVGANAVITKDVPDNSVVGGINHILRVK